MSFIYHTTMTQARAHSFYLESISHAKLLSLLNTISTAVVTNIKKVEYSKAFGVNYTGVPIRTIEPSYQRVEVFCRTKDRARVLTLYDVKKSVTDKSLTKSCKRLMIEGEKIIDVYNILYYDNSEGVARSFKNLYQIAYRKDSRPHYSNLEAVDYKELKEFFYEVHVGELEEIRKFEHIDNTKIKDDKDYIKYCKIEMKSGHNGYANVRIPNIRKNLKLTPDLLNQYLTLNSQKIQKYEVSYH